jgi:hypothetical protein
MKKVGAVLFLISVAFVLSFGVVSAVACNQTSDCSSNQTCVNNTCINQISSASPTSAGSQITLNQSVQDKAYACLESKVSGKCSTLSVSEMSLVLLSNPNQSLSSECRTELINKRDGANCWPRGACTIKDTALAVLALNNYGEDTSDAENWLISKNRTADLVWFLEQDAANATQCKITYSANDYLINVGENKRINEDAGPCLSRAQANFWLQISPSCYDNEFSILCDQNFVSALLYKYEDSSTIFVSSDTKSSPAGGTTSLKINARCFGLNSCDYEGSLWATLALLKTQHDIANYLPYIVAGSENNKPQLPDAFIYKASGYEDYGTRLIQQQRTVGNYWEADNSAHGRFYDTALALLALTSSSSDQVNKAKIWLQIIQDTTGCWKTGNDVRDTAIILWAITTRSPNGGVSSTTRCSQANFFCIPSVECPSSEKLGNFYCDGLMSCCKTENLKSCSEYGGVVCNSTAVCSGNERRASDDSHCCLSSCIIPQVDTGNECENSGKICRSACASNQVETNDACSGTDVCCENAPVPPSYLWVWLLIIGIIIILGIIGYLYRNKLKLWWFNMRHKVKTEGNNAPQQPPFGPRPGFPPIRRGGPMPAPVRQPIPSRPVSPQLQPKSGQKLFRKDDDTFKKLREMSK